MEQNKIVFQDHFLNEAAFFFHTSVIFSHL